jgi:hypothetical protein
VHQRQLRNGKRRTFILTEVPEADLEAYLAEENRKPSVDILVLLYDRDERAKLFLE